MVFQGAVPNTAEKGLNCWQAPGVFSALAAPTCSALSVSGAVTPPPSPDPGWTSASRVNNVLATGLARCKEQGSAGVGQAAFSHTAAWHFLTRLSLSFNSAGVAALSGRETAGHHAPGGPPPWYQPCHRPEDQPHHGVVRVQQGQQDPAVQGKPGCGTSGDQHPGCQGRHKFLPWQVQKEL